MMEPLRFSTLRWMARSPAHAYYALTHPTPDTPAMRFGRLIHSVFLGRGVPTVFKGERRGNAWKNFKEEHDGEDIITEEELERAAAIAANLHVHREARQLLMGERERTVLFDFAGRPCRTTPDVFTPSTLTELKSTTDASPSRFPFHAVRMGYHAQLAWQKDGLKAAGVADPERLSIIAVEVKPPYAICVFGVTPRAEDYGRRQYRTWLEEFLSYERSGTWPGYPEGVLDAPEDAVHLVGPGGETFDVEDL